MIIKEDVINDVVLFTTNILRRINHLLTTRLIRASASVGIFLILFLMIKEDVINDVVLFTTNILRRINHLLTTRLIRASASVGIFLILFLMIKIKKQKLRQ